MDFERHKVIHVTINNKEFKVTPDIPADTSLNTFIRDHANLKGTKYMCKEGGCGACIVTVQSMDPVSKKEKIYGINSCLVPVWSCDGRTITTIEGIGNKRDGYHKIQKHLNHLYGSQCGFCSPGMIMNMYSLLMAKPNITMEEIENSFGGNICRCTGYRPILDAFKALASNATDDLRRKIADIEDIIKIDCTNSIYNGNCIEKCNGCPKKKSSVLIDVKIDLEGNSWYSANCIEDIFNIFNNIGNDSYILTAGCTAKGVYKMLEKPKNYIDITNITELKKHKIFDEKIVIGANITLARAMELFSNISQTNPKKFHYLKQLEEHIDLIANVPVRNIGTLAGNLMIKHTHKHFPSDIFLILETVGAQLLLESTTGLIGPIPIVEFLKHNMKKKIIRKIILPALPRDETKLKTFKIMPRKQNVHALLNAGFLFRLGNGNIVLDKPSIVFGGISEDFIHAENTEYYFKGKCILDQKVFEQGLKILAEELNPKIQILESSPEYRKKLALALFYRFVLSINPVKIKPCNLSGMENLKRPLSKGKQIFDNKNIPAGKPFKKLEAIIQCSGEAEYTGDIPAFPGQVYGALVLARKARATLQSIDPKEALKIPGVLAFYTAKDIPGKNSFIQTRPLTAPCNEEIFCSDKILYAGQPVGVIIADKEELAVRAAKKVHISYSNKEKPLLNVREVLEADDKSRILVEKAVEPKIKPNQENVKYKIKGEVELGSQYHFTMETQSCVCVPSDEGLDVYSATQWMHNIQGSIAGMLKIPENRINMKVKRIGGGFGGKITRSSLIANACALASHKLNRPVKIVLDLETNMESIGKRCPALSIYEAGFDLDGRIQYLNVDVYDDVGCSLNDPSALIIYNGLQNAYDYSTWKYTIYNVFTDNASTSWMRAPGTLEGFTTIETIMEHIATTLGKDPLVVRMANFNRKHTLLYTLVENMLIDSDYKVNQLAIKKYNDTNRWKKRGMSLIPMVFPIDFFFTFHVMMSIYSDGTVAITHGGIEMGQGVNTKVAQAVSHALSIDMDMIQFKASSNLTAPNDAMSGASVTSESCAHAALKCCEILIGRLQPLKEKMNNPTWKELIFKAYVKEIDLNASYMNSQRDSQAYNVFAVGLSQVEVDLLTGNYQILRTDILEDAGDSLSPWIDIGQVEGAFVMGLGYFLTENIEHDKESGMVVSNRTWNYWPPGVKDIPIEFRVTLAKNVPNPVGVLRSKSTGEPPICLAFSAVTAIRDALKSARWDSGLKNQWFNLDQPCSVEKTFLAANTSHEQFTI